MLACLDVDYRPDGSAVAACLLFTSWQSVSAEASAVARITAVAPYTPGLFFERELPCLLKVLSKLEARPSLIIVDGYVHLDASERPGLGAHLFEALQCEVPIVGVAKTAFRTATTALPIIRGTGSKPLWVSAVGVAVQAAAAHVACMAGPYRVPSLLREVDQLARAASPG